MNITKQASNIQSTIKSSQFVTPPNVETFETLTIISGIGTFKGSNLPILSIYQGKKASPIYNYFVSGNVQDIITKYKDQETARIKGKENDKIKSKQLKEQARNAVKLGDVFSSSWGYDQTNVDFYQIIAINGNMCTMAQMETLETPSTTIRDYGKATPGKIISNQAPTKHVVKMSTAAGGLYFKICSYAHAYLWDGTPCHISHTY